MMMMKMMMHLDGYQRRRSGGEKVSNEPLSADERHRVGIVFVEEVQHLVGALQTLEHVERHEERHRPRFVLIRQGDHPTHCSHTSHCKSVIEDSIRNVKYNCSNE